MEIDKMLTLSTLHITPETANQLEVEDGSNWSKESIYELPIYKKNEYGWFIKVPDKNYDEYPWNDDLEMIFQYARKHYCSWLCLDRDGEINKDLIKYINEWEKI